MQISKQGLEAVAATAATATAASSSAASAGEATTAAGTSGALCINMAFQELASEKLHTDSRFCFAPS